MEALNLTVEQRILIAKALKVKEKEYTLSDYKRYSSRYLWITDKKGDKIKLTQNNVQRKLDAVLDECKANDKPARVIVLKSRQMGISTDIEGRMIYETTNKKNRNGLVIAHRDDSTAALFAKTKYYYDNLESDVRPLNQASNAKELIFDRPTHYYGDREGMHSKIKVQTAGNAGIGRSDTFHYVHLSEFAFWEGKDKNSPAKQLSGILQSVPKSPDTWVIIESTANGMNDFKEEWDKAVRGESGFIPLFLAWYDHEEYVEEVEDKDTFIQGMKDYEKWLYYDLGLPVERVAWWRHKLKYDCNGDINMMRQENPTTPEEAFIFSGTPVFDNDRINKRIQALREHYLVNPYKTGYFEFEWNDPETKDKIKRESIRFVESASKAHIRLYEAPNRGCPYVIGGDTKGEGADYFAGTVIDNTTGKRVATLHMQTTNSKPYTWQMYCLGIYYNMAMIGIEMNFNTAPIEELQRLSYPFQYMRRKYDEITKKIDTKYGWKTDGNTRPLIIDKEVGMVEDHIELFYDIQTLLEMTTFVYDKDGRPDAMSGKHDDLLISDMIANEIRPQQRFEYQKESEVKPVRLKDQLMKPVRGSV